MTKKEMTVGKTTIQYNINDFKDWLMEQWTFALDKNKPCVNITQAICLLNEFEKECKNGK